jgi:hypothetical protein
MRKRIALVSMLGLGLMAFVVFQSLAETVNPTVDCSQGGADEQVACLNKKVAALEAKIDELFKESIKWNDRISLINEDMRIFPRCLENPGPDSRQLTDVYANSCAKIAAQAWMVRKAYQGR